MVIRQQGSRPHDVWKSTDASSMEIERYLPLPVDALSGVPR